MHDRKQSSSSRRQLASATHETAGLSRREVSELAARARGGDTSAQQALFDRFAPLVEHVLAPYRHDALYEDLQGEVYILFRDLLLHFDPERGAALSTWLAKELPLRVRSYVRAQRRAARRLGSSIDPLPERSDDAGRLGGEVGSLAPHLAEQAQSAAGDSEQGIILRILIEAALKALSEEERRLVLLHVVDRYTFEEIAPMLRKEPEARRQAYKRALPKLRKALEKDLGGGSHESGV